MTAARRSARDWLGVVLLSVLGALLRLIDLTRFELWVDEAATWHYGRLAASWQLAEQMRLEPTPPLYYALVGWVMRLFGDGDLAMRLPSVVLSTLAVGAAMVLTERLGFSRRAAAWAGLFVAVHPLLVFLGREARVYPLLAFLTLLVALALRRALDDDRLGSWALVTLLCAVTCYSHFYGMFVTATAGGLAVLLAPDARRRLRGVAAAALAGLLFAPYVLATLPHLRTSGAAWSVATLYEILPEERGLERVLEGQAIGARYHALQRQLARPQPSSWLRAGALAAQLFLLAGAARAWAAARRARASAPGRRRLEGIAIVVGFWWLPVLIPWTITHVVGRPIFQPGRHDAFVVPFACCLLGVGMAWWLERAEGSAWTARTRSAGRALAVGCGLLLVAVAGLRLWWLHQHPADRMREAKALWIAEHFDRSVPVITLGINRLATERVLRQAGSAAPMRSFPGSTDSHPGWIDDEVLLQDPGALRAEARAVAASLDDRSGVVVVTRPVYGSPERPSRGYWVDYHLSRALLERGFVLEPTVDGEPVPPATLVFRRPRGDG